MSAPLHLLFDPVELPRIRATLARPEFASFWRWCREADLADDEHFLRDELKLDHPKDDLARAANILQRSAFVHAVAPDPRHLAVARLALSRLLEFRRWDWILEAGRDTVGAMRNGTTAIAAVLGADWLAAELSTAEYDAVAHFIANEAGPAAERAIFGMTHHDQVAGWGMDPAAQGFDRAYLDIDFNRWPAILDLNNLRIIATAGLAAAAAFLHNRHPRAAHWAAMAEASMRLFVSRLPQDGAFPEGPDYWHFTFNYFCVSAELLHRRCGRDLRDAFDFPAMARYVQMVSVPTLSLPDGCLNIGDAFKMSGAEPLAWIGRHFRDATANQLVLQTGTVRDLPNSAWAAIWFDPAVPARRSADLALDRVLFPGVVVARSGWGGTDSVFSLRGGEPENHEHADRNSLLFTAHGERLLNDPLKASYLHTQPKWLLRLTAAHTALLIDGRGHQYHHGEEGTNASQARATLVDYRTGRDWMRVTSDAADAYAKAGLPVIRAQRTVVFFKPDILLVLDEVDLSQALPVQTRWQVYNDDGHGAVAADDTGFTITRPHASLRATVSATGAVSLKTGALPMPPAEGVYPFAEVVSPSAPRHHLLTVCTAAPTNEAHAVWTITPAPDGWQVAGAHRGRIVDLRLASRPLAPPLVVF
ncbi:MAG: heparinase II/III family protein [Opitutaceae bacterium]|nr:heparinase II/III family protein [Opitutaceae bacterium]